MKRSYFLNILMLFVLNTCAQKKNNIDMNTLINNAYQAIPKHKQQPIYGLQVDKMGCRLSVSINNETLGDYFAIGGYSATETINGHILSSGEQQIKVVVYPRAGMDYIDDLAHIKLELFYVKQKGDDMDTYQVLKTLELPKGLKDKKLPHFEISLPFQATVPWNYSTMYNDLSDLRKVPDIEKKVLAEYERIRNLIVNNDQEKYLNARLKNKRFEYEPFYMTKEEITEYVDWIAKDATPLLNKEVLPIKNYEMIFEKEGKKVFLRDKTSRGGVIKIEYGPVIMEGEYKGRKGKEMFISSSLVLPKGKTEFECL